ncbi:MAG: hypothetical protein Q7J55_01880 [bacterium]|nr:hypothetical protein [bacterium]
MGIAAVLPSTHRDDRLVEDRESEKIGMQVAMDQNPAGNLSPNEEKEIVRYIIKDWKNSAEKMSG